AEPVRRPDDRRGPPRCRNPAIRHEIHEAFMTSPPPLSAGDTSSADHLPGLISAQIRAPRRVNTQVNQLHAVRACEGVTSRVPGDDGSPLGSHELPRAFRTADLWLIHAADCCSRYS